MSWHNKVVWNEGLFLRPQLFQQQERYLEHYAHKRSAPLSPFFWGFSHFSIDSEALTLGKLILQSAAGVFADGTCFDIPGSTPPPRPLTIQAEHLEQEIYLAVPVRIPNGEETCFDDASDSLARYTAYDYELRDANAIRQGPKLVQLSTLRLRLLPQKELTDGWIGLSLARIAALRPDGSVALHDDIHIPPVNAYGADPLLKDWLGKTLSLVRLRATALANRLTGSDGKTAETAEVADYLLLQILNRYEPYLTHLQRVVETSPAELYTALITLAGELSTFVRPDTRRPKEHPAYQHTRLYDCIKPVVADVQQLLNEVLIRSAQLIPLEDKGHGLRLAVVDTAMLASFSALVLAISADMPRDVLQSRFMAQSKLAPPEHINDIIRSHLPGIALQALPVPPRQIPFNAGYVYYEVSRNSPLWAEVMRRGGLALHTAGEFPGLALQLWGIREK
ncbi:type VI secretion system baseplate subunit TssK [Thauera sinica]|uniref:Type VI secretion system baseplate subunit TssK n=1 Tax=Thauera sinica TaxID=2665146 RepID=A0ABW1ATK5_9RHOO|nr:type VI secretion system baseplate subunit TssK [Thauera sp. K11]ATE59927.1 type VI secretion system baseplate subunit TssK [Thauera sp. K11]